MNKKLRYALTAGFFFTAVLGTLLHFTYEWSKNNTAVGLFSPVNESTWEHMKLLFFPMLLYGIYIMLQFRKQYPCIISGISAGILTGTLLIPVFFYTYTGILGTHFLWLDIAVFLFSTLLAFLISYYLTINCYFKDYKSLFLFLLVIMALGFFIFTSYPPDIGLFQNP